MALIGILAAVTINAFSVDRGRAQASKELEVLGAEAVQRVEDVTAEAADRLTAVAGLFRASEHVTPDEFEEFVGGIGLSTGMVGLGYIAVVPAAELDEFVATASDDHGFFAPFALDERANPRQLGEREQYEIVLHVVPSARYAYLRGADVGSQEIARSAMEKAARQDEASVTGLFQVPGERDADGFIMVQPVPGGNGSVVGFTIGLMDLSGMFSAELAGTTPSGVRWQIDDVTEAPRGDDPEAPWSTVLEIQGRLWQLDVIPGVEFTAWTLERTISLLVGIAAAIVAGVLTFVLRERGRSRREFERLAELSLQKDQFLATVSHELRTPLTAVVGFIDELKNRPDELDASESLELLRIAGEEAGEMTALVDDLLVGARIGTGNPLTVTIEPVDLAGAVKWVSRHLPRTGDVRVEMTGAGWAKADRMRVRQILRNLMDNAVKHGSPPMTVAIETDDERCRVVVSDGGEGVPECCHALIFDMAPLPVDHAHPIPADSNGLGLPVSRYLARLMGGDLRYLADEAAFELDLPLAGATDSSGARAPIRARSDVELDDDRPHGVEVARDRTREA